MKQEVSIYYDLVDASDKLHIDLLHTRLKKATKALAEHDDEIPTATDILRDPKNKGLLYTIKRPVNRDLFNRLLEIANIVQRGINIDNSGCLQALAEICKVLYHIDLQTLPFEVTEQDVLKYHVIKIFFLIKAHEALGYWNSRLPSSKREYTAGKKSGKIRVEKATSMHKVWQDEADTIWKNHPEWGKSEVARRLVKKFGGSLHTYRQNIKKPSFHI